MNLRADIGVSGDQNVRAALWSLRVTVAFMFLAMMGFVAIVYLSAATFSF